MRSVDNAFLITRLDELTKDILALQRLSSGHAQRRLSLSKDIKQTNSGIMNNLEDCVRSEDKIVSAVSAIVRSRGVFQEGRGVVDVDHYFSEEVRSDVESNTYYSSQKLTFIW